MRCIRIHRLVTKSFSLEMQNDSPFGDYERLFRDVLRFHCSMNASVSLEMHHSHYCQVSQKYRFTHSDLILLDVPASTNRIDHRPMIESSNCYRQTIRNSSNLSVVDPPVVIARAADEQLLTNYNDFFVNFSSELVSKNHLRYIENLSSSWSWETIIADLNSSEKRN